VSNGIIEACKVRKIQVNCEEGNRVCIGCYWMLMEEVRKSKEASFNIGPSEDALVTIEEAEEEPVAGPSGVKGIKYL